MKIEKLNYEKEKVHKILLYGLISVVVLLLAITLITSKANYKISSSVQLATGKINYKAPDLNVIAIYVNNGDGNYVEQDKDTLIPSADYYEINEEKSYCYKTTSTEHDSNVKLYTSIYDEHVIKGLSRNDKCYLYFDKIKDSTESRTMEQLIANYYVHKKYRLASNKDFNASFGEETRKTLYIADDDYGTSYYFAGAPLDNWVKFGKENGNDIWWRIIRINGNGSIRLIYTGTTAPTSSQASVMTGEQTLIGTTEFNTQRNNNMYVGFYYTNGQVHGYEIPSNIYSNPEGDASGKSLKGFYEKNIKGQSYEKWIDKNVGFCNDRQPSSSASTLDNIGGIELIRTYYASGIRVNPGKNPVTSSSLTVDPSLKCSYQGTSENSYKDSDLFTAKNTTNIGLTNGNKLLDYPVGLITVDEASYAGLAANHELAVNTNYLFSGLDYWTMSSDIYVDDGGYAGVFRVTGNGIFWNNYANSNLGVRPVINLKADTPLIGNGTYNNPYRLAD